MNENNEIFNDDLELENILKPNAEFRVSTGFKQRVMDEAKAMPIRRRRRWIPVAVFSAAASLSALVIITLSLFRHPEFSEEAPDVTASIEVSARPSADSIKKETSGLLIVESTPPITQNTPSSQRRTAKRKSHSKAVSSPRTVRREETGEVHPLPVTEGEMRKISREGPLNPNEVRTHLLETRRNAEIAYIEQMRNEIEANQAYIAQLMAEADVNQ